MGLWWKNVDAQPPEDAEKFITFKADPEALSKRWPILWRFCQNWHIIKVTVFPKPCKLYFRSESGQTMLFRGRIFSDYVAVRVGSEDVMFWVVCGTGIYPKMARMNITIPGMLRRDKRDIWQKQGGDRFKHQAQFV